MKKTFLILLLIPCFGYSQHYLGQSRKYIMNDFEECYIRENKAHSIDFQCKETLYTFCFDAENLCGFYGITVKKERREGLVDGYIKEGYTQTQYIDKDGYEITELTNDKYKIQVVNDEKTTAFIFHSHPPTPSNPPLSSSK